MSMKKQLKGALVKDGKFRLWTGVPFGVLTPIVASQISKSLWANYVATANPSDPSNLDLGAKMMPYKAFTLASPFLVALPFLFFKKTRRAGFGIVGGGVLGDIIYLLAPNLAPGSAAGA